MSKKIDLLFTNQEDRQVTISIDNPAEPVDVELVQAVMETIISENVFVSSGGTLTAIRGARLVDHQVTDIPVGQ
ncbi:DUF2922 domain-containing protein [Alkalicoccobacillus porphyridii]|uniref:DUF2922 domain-containing protein n=1 Tax=Alkalicoccobacillus porphyridii TaxID=2597270 RepID=A0A553ZZ06_9BACI|nr:DUF2922 domain-containing protein [Alkalicoccobacillus porphyridii]TSB46687.1 DUF2922 domain-containing protein [Alkalicoccobacillus porphyridii]